LKKQQGTSMPCHSLELACATWLQGTALAVQGWTRGIYEVIYETQHAGIVPERAGARIRLLEAAIVFARRTEPGSSG
jgi:hypothetical protein